MSRKRGFTLAETLIVMVVITLIITAAIDIYNLGGIRWNAVSSKAEASRQMALIHNLLTLDVTKSVSLQVETVGGNTVYTLTLPANTDSSGNYVPVWSNGALVYQAGAKVRYYLSDTTGGLSVTGGTTLWRATAPAGSSTYTPDSAWALAGGQPRFTNLSSFWLSSGGQILYGFAQGTAYEEGRSFGYFNSFSIPLRNHNYRTIALPVNTRATYLRTHTGDSSALSASPIDLQALGINPGDSIQLNVTAYFNTSLSSTAHQPIGVFSSTTTLLPDKDQLSRVSGAVTPSFTSSVTSVSTPATQSGGWTTNISQDFTFSQTGTITVPTNGRYLFLSVYDDQYSNNFDTGNDYYVQITKL